MAEAAAVVEQPPRKGFLARLILPLALLLAGAGAGAAGAYFVPILLPNQGKETPPKPQVAPLQYVEIDNNFTANLQDTGRFAQVRIAVSTQGGTPVVDAVTRHKPAIVAAVLSILAEAGEEDLHSSAGREALTRRMRIAINDVLQRKSGIAGIDDVFLVNFVLQ